MKKIILAFLIIAGCNLCSYGAQINEVDCSYNGIPLYGKVRVVENFEDIKVKVVNSFEDIRVKKVDNFATSCGRWQFTNSFEDFKIKFVDNFEDIKIKFTNSFEGI